MREYSNSDVSETPNLSKWVNAVSLGGRVSVCVCFLCQPLLASQTMDVRVKDTFTFQA